MTLRKERAYLAQIAAKQRRGDRFKAQVHKLKREIVVERRKIAEAYCKGSAETMSSVYAALPSDEVAIWLSQAMMLSRKKKPPFGLSPEIEAAARADAAAILGKYGVSIDGPDDIIKEIAL
jgi:hypothetical protein